MSQQDLTADMLTRIRNATRIGAKHVQCPATRLNKGVAEVLVNEGFIRSFETTQDGPATMLRLNLKYGPHGEQVINSIDRVSKPGRRVYRGHEELPRPLQGLGISIVSTSRGVMSDRLCREQRVGGEIVATVT
jgi:small subunit ribosomal protein S8